MSSTLDEGQRSFRVPKENNRFLCIPPAILSPELLARNGALFANSSVPQWLSNLRHLARTQAVEAAQIYCRDYARYLVESCPPFDHETSKLVVGGHQPELFHPGVWFKNFLLGAIASRTQSLGLHVIIDHDLARADSLKVPYFADGHYFQRSIALPIQNEAKFRMPWHATPIATSNLAAWQATLASLKESMTSCGISNSMLLDQSDLLFESLAHCSNIGDAFSRFRHRIELDHGLRNFEVPISHLCQRSAFGLFVYQCVQNAESLWNSYNRCRTDYRSRHSIRNEAQPVLELQRNPHALELPFWIYNASIANVERNRLWIISQDNQMWMCDHPKETHRKISIRLPDTESEFVSLWDELVATSICIRPRALMTTMYLRCMVADLFVHGIGGGAYDELTDDIIRDWLKIDSPQYMTCSASLHLNMQPSIASNLNEEHASLQQELHKMRSAPERYLNLSLATHRDLHSQYSQRIANIPPRGRKRDWHHDIARLKQSIQEAIAEKKRHLLDQFEASLRKIQQQKIQQSREYSFVLFPEMDVISRLQHLVA